MPRLLLILPVCVFGACSVYPSWEGVYNSGPVDPIVFPPPYLGTGGDRTRPALGSFTAIAAKAGGEDVQYFAFPFSPAALPSKPDPKIDPLAVTIGGKPNPALPVPTVEVFDGKPGERAFRASPNCAPPSDYSYDPRRDDMRMDEQSPVFSALPTANYDTAKLTVNWSYSPVVAEVATSNGDACQKFRTMPDPAPTLADGSGYFLAWAIIDTGAGVYRAGEDSKSSSGLGLQKYGWFNYFFLAFLDGGYIPTRVDTAMDGTEVLRMVTQKLYYPRSKVTTKTGDVSGAVGKGYDVLEVKRPNVGYSPICEVHTYDAGGPLTQDKLPQDADTVVATYGMTLQPANPPYFFCLQVE